MERTLQLRHLLIHLLIDFSMIRKSLMLLSSKFWSHLMPANLTPLHLCQFWLIFDKIPTVGSWYYWRILLRCVEYTILGFNKVYSQYWSFCFCLLLVSPLPPSPKWYCFTRNFWASYQQPCNLRNGNETLKPCIYLIVVYVLYVLFGNVCILFYSAS